MRFAALLLFAATAFAEQPVKVQTIYVYADGRKVVIEETSDLPRAKTVAKAASCPTCGSACQCGSTCQCDAASWVATCTAVTAAARVKYTAPPGYTIPPYSGYRGYFDVPQYTTPRSVASGPPTIPITPVIGAVVQSPSLPVLTPMVRTPIAAPADIRGGTAISQHAQQGITYNPEGYVQVGDIFEAIPVTYGSVTTASAGRIRYVSPNPVRNGGPVPIREPILPRRREAFYSGFAAGCSAGG